LRVGCWISTACSTVALLGRAAAYPTKVFHQSPGVGSDERRLGARTDGIDCGVRAQLPGLLGTHCFRPVFESGLASTKTGILPRRVVPQMLAYQQPAATAVRGKPFGSMCTRKRSIFRGYGIRTSHPHRPGGPSLALERNPPWWTFAVFQNFAPVEVRIEYRGRHTVVNHISLWTKWD